MMSISPDALGHHTGEPMTMGTPTSPTSPQPAHQSQYLPGYLLGDSMSHAVSPGSRLWSSSAGQSPPRSVHRGPSTLTSPNSSAINTGTPRLDASMRGKEKGGAPPIHSLFTATSPSTPAVNSPFSTPAQALPRTLGLSTPAPPVTGLSQAFQDSVYTPEHSAYHQSRIPASPAQLDPFYTQGDLLTTEDVLDDTWVTVFGFPPAAASFVLQQFSQYGNILKRVISTDGNWMHLHYQSKIQAKKALSKNGKVLGNSIMVGVANCIDKKVMEGDRDNDSLSTSCTPFGTPSASVLPPTVTVGAKHTPIRPLTAAYKAARSENEVLQNSAVPKKNSGFINKAMEYMFGW